MIGSLRPIVLAYFGQLMTVKHLASSSYGKWIVLWLSFLWFYLIGKIGFLIEKRGVKDLLSMALKQYSCVILKRCDDVFYSPLLSF